VEANEPDCLWTFKFLCVSVFVILLVFVFSGDAKDPSLDLGSFGHDYFICFAKVEL
jgi:hypothetical protein